MASLQETDHECAADLRFWIDYRDSHAYECVKAGSEGVSTFCRWRIESRQPMTPRSVLPDSPGMGWPALVAAALLAGAAGCQPSAVADPVSDTQAKLESLPVKGRAPKTGYSRGQFGDAWSDDVSVVEGHNGCDTRNDVLRAQLVDVVIKPGTNGCVVLSGILNDPYTGITVEFHRGPDSSDEVQIDHVVALSDAWQTGAQQLDEATRRNFANDPTNLQATLGWVNQEKGDSDAASWLPSNSAYRCTYASRIVDVKATYRLWVTQPEHDAIARVLSTDCGKRESP